MRAEAHTSRMNRLPQFAGAIIAAAILLLVALYVIRPHQTEVSSPPSARLPTAARSVYPSIVVDTPRPPAPSPDRTPRILDVESGDVRTLSAPDLTFTSLLSDGSLFFANGNVGPAQVTASDGSVIAMLDVPASREYRLSEDRRYVAWLSIGDRLQVYDSATKDVGSALPDGARFTTSLPDGALLLPADSGSAVVEANG